MKSTLRNKLIAAAASLTLVSGFGAVMGAEVAHAADAFYAQACHGETLDDPKNAGGPVSDLTHVFGARLDQYNAGGPVVLYDTFGSNIYWEDGGELESTYPAVCTVREVNGQPVSEWAFCTDYFSQVCSGVDASGNLLDDNGNIIPGMTPVDSASVALSAQDQLLIAHLIRHGLPYSGTGQWSWSGETFAEANASVNSRLALQTLRLVHL